jgi:hypothetical protein
MLDQLSPEVFYIADKSLSLMALYLIFKLYGAVQNIEKDLTVMTANHDLRITNLEEQKQWKISSAK